MQFGSGRTIGVLIGCIGLVSILLALSGCARDRTPPATSVALAITASSEVNPDRNDRPSPILVRIYELRSAGVFSSADFFTLLEQDGAVLGSDQVSRWEMQLDPGQSVTLDRDFQSGSTYLGVLAAYRDIEHARWRVYEPLQINRSNALDIRIERDEVTVRSR